MNFGTWHLCFNKKIASFLVVSPSDLQRSFHSVLSRDADRDRSYVRARTKRTHTRPLRDACLNRVGVTYPAPSSYAVVKRHRGVTNYKVPVAR